MERVLAQFASTGASEQTDLFASIGVDWKLLILQTIAFLILLWFLAKFVYPPLVAMLDAREKKIADSLRVAAEAERKAVQTQQDIEKLLSDARVMADDILNNAKDESAQLVATAEKRSRERAKRIIEDAEADMRNSIEEARVALKKETVELVALATEKVIGSTVSATIDTKIIAQAVKETQ